MNKVLIYSSDYDFIQTLNDELKDYTSISIFYFFDIHEIIEKIKKTQFELVIIDLNKNYEKINFKYLSEINSDNIVFLYGGTDNIEISDGSVPVLGSVVFT